MERLRTTTYNLLRKMEKYTRTDMIYLTKGGFWLGLGQFLSASASFLLAIAFAHFTTKEVYGSYKYIISVAAIISTFTLTGIGSALIQSFAKGLDKTLFAGFKLTLKWSIFVVIGFVGAGIYYLSHGNHDLGISLIIIAIVHPLLKAVELYSAFLMGKKEFRINTLYNTLRDLFSAAMLFIGMYVYPNTIFLVCVFYVSNLVANAFFYWRVVRTIKHETPIDYEALSFAKHLSFINIFLNISAQVDKIIVFHYLGAAELAIYTYATAIPKQFRALMGLLGTLAQPKLAGRSVNEIVASIPKKFLMLLYVLGPAIIVYILLAPTIYKIFFPQYIGAVFYSQVYALILLVMGNFSDLGLTVKQAVKEKYALNISMSILSMVSQFILVQSMGIMGVIVATIATKYITSILSYILLRRIREPA
jgi:O-antigen/teichoic acid export membrane protein